MDSKEFLSFLLALMLEVQGLSGSFCYERQYSYYYSSYYYTYYDYCTYGCCGYTTFRYCCSYYNTYDKNTSKSTSVSLGVILGGVVGGLAFLGILISVIGCICKRAGGRRPTRVTAVAPAATTPAVNMDVPPQQYYPMYNQHVAPPSYNTTQGFNPGYPSAAPHPNYPPPLANVPTSAFPPPPVEQPEYASPFVPSGTSG